MKRVNSLYFIVFFFIIVTSGYCQSKYAEAYTIQGYEELISLLEIAKLPMLDSVLIEKEEAYTCPKGYNSHLSIYPDYDRNGAIQTIQTKSTKCGTQTQSTKHVTFSSFNNYYKISDSLNTFYTYTNYNDLVDSIVHIRHGSSIKDAYGVDSVTQTEYYTYDSLNRITEIISEITGRHFQRTFQADGSYQILDEQYSNSVKVVNILNATVELLPEIPNMKLYTISGKKYSLKRLSSNQTRKITDKDTIYTYRTFDTHDNILNLSYLPNPYGLNDDFYNNSLALGDTLYMEVEHNEDSLPVRQTSYFDNARYTLEDVTYNTRKKITTWTKYTIDTNSIDTLYFQNWVYNNLGEIIHSSIHSNTDDEIVYQYESDFNSNENIEVQKIWNTQRNPKYAEITYHYRTTPEAISITLLNNKELSITFNYRLDTSFNIKEAIGLAYLSTQDNMKVLQISSIQIDSVNPKILVLLFNRTMHLGETFELYSKAPLQFSDGRTGTLTITTNQGDITYSKKLSSSETTFEKQNNSLHFKNKSGINLLTIYSIHGVQCFSKQYNTNTEISLDLSGFSSGSYVVVIRSNTSNSDIFRFVH